jgi:signal transduction histidine kinase
MPPNAPRSSARLRSARDRVLVHDIKNMSFRLRLLLSNLQEHWEDPDFRKTVRDLLAASVERLEGIADRLVEREDAVLIKVALDLNDLLRKVAARPFRRGGRSAGGPLVTLALGEPPQIWADPFYLADAIASLLENACEAAAPEGRVLIRTFSAGGVKRPRAVVEIIDNGAGMTSEFLRDRLFQPFETTKPQGVGLGMATANQIARLHRGTIKVLSQPGGGTLVRVSFPGIAAERGDRR